MSLKRIQHVTGILLAVKREERHDIQAVIDRFGITKVIGLVDGGSERQYSVAACIEAHRRGRCRFCSTTRQDRSFIVRVIRNLYKLPLNLVRQLRAFK